MFDDVINIMLTFMTNKVPFFTCCIFQIFCFFDTDLEKYATSKLSTKNRITCDINSINMWNLADEACRCTNFLNVMS